MTKRHITNPRDRRSKKYAAKHAELRADVYRPDEPEPDKAERKRAASLLFRNQAES